MEVYGLNEFDPVTALRAYFPAEIAVLNYELRQKFIEAIEELREANQKLETENKELKKRAVIF